MVRFICVAIFSVLATAAIAQEKLAYPQHYSVLTNDFADILTPEAEAEINAVLQAARDDRGREMTVVTIRSREDYLPSNDITSFSKALFNGWGIGNKDRNDGLLLLVAIDDREVRIALGAGYPARQDGIAARIIQSQIIPAFREGRVADGILAGTRAALSQIQHPEDPRVAPAPVTQPQAVPSPVSQQDPTPRPNSIIIRFLHFLADYPILLPLTPILLLVASFFGIRGILQYRPRKCPQCGNVMLRLGEAQEDQYLDQGQLVEENIKSKDYGVWFCTNDEHVTVKGYQSLFRRKPVCPDCSYHTRETTRTTLTAATTQSMGLARLDHICHNCDHTSTETVSTPKISKSSSSGSSSFGGGGGSSSFGGGSSSGGGASGSW